MTSLCFLHPRVPSIPLPLSTASPSDGSPSNLHNAELVDDIGKMREHIRGELAHAKVQMTSQVTPQMTSQVVTDITPYRRYGWVVSGGDNVAQDLQRWHEVEREKLLSEVNEQYSSRCTRPESFSVLVMQGSAIASKIILIRQVMDGIFNGTIQLLNVRNVADDSLALPLHGWPNPRELQQERSASHDTNSDWDHRSTRALQLEYLQLDSEKERTEKCVSSEGRACLF